MHESTASGSTRQNDEDIDLRELIFFLWARKWWILGCGIVGISIAAIYAYVIAKPVFESTALLLPTQTAQSADLGAAAAFLGKKNGNTADLDLYQSLLTSRSVIQKLIRESVINESDTGKGRNEPLFAIHGVDTANAIKMEDFEQSIAQSIIVGSKETGAGGILEVKVAAGSPWLAQQIGTNVLRIGQEELRIVRIQRSKVIMTRLSEAVALAKAEWDSAAKALTWYKDRNRSIMLPEQMLAISRLEIERQAKEQKYLMARRELETQLLEQAKAAPPMMILDPASRPTRKSKPKRTLIMALGLFAGCFGAAVGLIGWRALVDIR